MDSLSLVDAALAIGEEFPGWSFSDGEYEKLNENVTVGDVYRSLQTVHPPIEHADIWRRLSQLVANGRGVPAESIRPDTPLLRITG